MHARVGRGVVDEHAAVGVGNPTVGESHIHDVAQIFVAFRNEEISARLSDDARGVVESRHVHIQDIAQSVGRSTNAMRQMKPPLGSLDGVGAFAIFHFRDGVVVAGVDDFFVLHLSMGDVVDQCPTDAATAARIDETILRTGVEGVFAIDELRVQHNVALLRLRLQVGQTIPSLQVLGARNACRSGCRREVARLCVVVTLGTEHTVDPSVLMLRDAHVVDVGGRNDILGHGDGLVPEAEVVDAIGRFSHGEERFAVGTFDTHYEAVFALPLDGSAVERSIHHDALHEVGVVFFAEVILPLQWRMFCSQNGELPLLVDAIPPFQGFVFSRQQLLVMSTQRFYFFFEIAHLFFLLILFFFVVSLFRYCGISLFRYFDILIFRYSGVPFSGRMSFKNSVFGAS